MGMKRPGPEAVTDTEPILLVMDCVESGALLRLLENAKDGDGFTDMVRQKLSAVLQLSLLARRTLAH